MSRARAIDWQIIDRALVTWASGQADLPRESVLFMDQKKTQAQYPYVTLKRIAGPVRDNGLTDNRVSEKYTNTNNREMLKVTVSGARQFTVSVQAYSERYANPNLDAVAILSTLQSSLELEGVLEQLATDADLTLVEAGDVLDTSYVVGGEWVSRATMDVRFRVASVLTEDVDFIESVEADSDDMDISSIVIE